MPGRVLAGLAPQHCPRPRPVRPMPGPPPSRPGAALLGAGLRATRCSAPHARRKPGPGGEPTERRASAPIPAAPTGRCPWTRSCCEAGDRLGDGGVAAQGAPPRAPQHGGVVAHVQMEKEPLPPVLRLLVPWPRVETQGRQDEHGHACSPPVTDSGKMMESAAKTKFNASIAVSAQSACGAPRARGAGGGGGSTEASVTAGLRVTGQQSGPAAQSLGSVYTAGRMILL